MITIMKKGHSRLHMVRMHKTGMVSHSPKQIAKSTGM